MKNQKVEGTKTGKGITRKDAIKKTGYAALSAASMMLLLSNPKKAAAQESSPQNARVWPNRE